MFSFRNKLSPTTSTMLKLSRSPCTITVHQWGGPQTGTERIVHHTLGLHAALAHDEASSTLRDAAALRFMIELMQDAIRRLEQDELTIEAPNGSVSAAATRLLPAANTANDERQMQLPLNGFAGSAATLALGVAGALIAAGAFAPKNGSARRLARNGRTDPAKALSEPGQQ